MGDIFRRQYRELTQKEKDKIERIKTNATLLYADLDPAVCEAEVTMDGRAAALARTKMQEAVFWAVNSITG